MTGIKLKFHRTDTDTDTDTDDLGMRNFVNVYTIVYHVQYTYTCKRGHPQRTSSRGKARVRTKVGPTSRRAERAASAAERPAAARARHADFLARILARKSARKSVSVSVSVSVLWNLAITDHNTLRCIGTSTMRRSFVTRWKLLQFLLYAHIMAYRSSHGASVYFSLLKLSQFFHNAECSTPLTVIDRHCRTSELEFQSNNQNLFSQTSLVSSHIGRNKLRFIWAQTPQV